MLTIGCREGAKRWDSPKYGTGCCRSHCGTAGPRIAPKRLILKGSVKAKIGEAQTEATKMIRGLGRYGARLIRVGVFSLARDE